MVWSSFVGEWLRIRTVLTAGIMSYINKWKVTCIFVCGIIASTER